MFGYLTPYRPELKVREADLFQAVYCGLCRQLGRLYGPLARLTLNYDYAFLAMLAMSLRAEEPEIGSTRCIVHPVKACPCIRDDSAIVDSAHLAAILIYEKCRDNLADHAAGKKVLSGISYPMAMIAYKKAKDRRPDYAAWAEEFVRAQQEIEQDPSSGIDAAAEPTALFLSQVLSSFSEDETVKRILDRFGYFLGRAVYLFDALDDLEEDRRNGDFNPFLHLETYDREQATASLRMTIAEALRCFALLPSSPFTPLLENVLTYGMNARINEINGKEASARG